MKKYLVGICSYNEGTKIQSVIQRLNNYELYDVMIVDDGSTDGALSAVPDGIPLTIIRNESTMGAGYGVRQILGHAKQNGYTAVFFVSGNNKDDPADIEKLQKKIEEGCDIVQGSRYLAGGGYGNMPFYRRIATQIIHPLFFFCITGKRFTDTTNGFRAVRVSLVDDERINLNQPWLDKYELEPYLLYKTVTLGYRVVEVPVKKIYPAKSLGYTKMKPFSGWWSILRPLVYLALRIKR